MQRKELNMRWRRTLKAPSTLTNNVLFLLAIVGICESRFHNGCALIIVKTRTDIERGLPIPLVTDCETDFIIRPLEQDDVIPRAEISHSVHFTIKYMNTTETIPVQDGALRVNLTKDDINATGKYVLELRTQTTYTLFVPHSICKPSGLQCLYSTKVIPSPFFMREVNRHIHLYVFDSPVLSWGENNRTLVCQLSPTSGFRDILVSFTREYKEGNMFKNVTVGYCVKYSRQEYHGIQIFYNVSNNTCVLVLPDTITQQDTGNYSCSLRVTDPESDDKGIMIDGMGHERVTTQPPSPEPKVIYALLLEIFIPILVIVIVILAGGMLFYAVVKNRGNVSRPNSSSPNDRTLFLSSMTSYSSFEYITIAENQSQTLSPRPNGNNSEISTGNEDLQQSNDINASGSLLGQDSLDTAPSSSSSADGNASPDPVSSEDINSSAVSQLQPPAAGSLQPHSSIDSTKSKSSDVDSFSSSQWSQSVDDKSSPKAASIGSVSHSVDTVHSRSLSASSYSSSTDDDSSSKQKQASVSAAGSLQPHSMDTAVSRSSSDVDSPLVSSSSSTASATDSSSADGTGSILSTGTSVKKHKHHGTTESKYEKEGNQERKKKKSSRK